MRNLILVTGYFVIGLGLGAVAAKAEPASCKQIGDAAALVMDHRQNGMPLSTLMELADAESSEFFKAMILAAFSYPAMSSDKYKAEAKREFRADYELRCYTARGGS